MSDRLDNVAPAGDQDVRDAALDVGQSFIVRAPAGSGKTRLLIQRYLALLACVDEPEEIVAITFTRKAAAEMRERVLDAFASARDPEMAMDDTTRRLAVAALEHDCERDWQLEANASRLRIQTIDSLNASITRQMPLAARFGAQPESIDNADPLYREAARLLLAEVNADNPLAEDVAMLLAHLDNNLQVAENLLAEMLRSRDHWLRNLPEMHQRETLEVALMRARSRAVALVARHFPLEETDKTLELARFSGRNWPADRANAGVSILSDMQALPGRGEAAASAWLALADLFLTQSGSWRKRKGLNKNIGFPTSNDKEEKAVFDAAKARMGELLERLEAAPQSEALARAWDNLRRLPPARYSEQQWAVLGAIVRLLPQATGLLWTVFGSHGQCDFTEIAQSASRALGPDEAPSDLALALDYRIRHLLVDEFQDTSFAQFELLQKLTRGWMPDDGRTLLVVGDPMQSIYRFREAEVGLFLRAMQHGIGDVSLQPLKLAVNFRSVPGVVNWVNDTFRQLMPHSDDDGGGQVPYASCVAYRGGDDNSEPSVVWHPQFIRKLEGDLDDQLPTAAEEEARMVVEIIRAARQRDTAAEIALLVRNRTHLAGIVPALKNAEITFRAVDIDPLRDRPVVQDLLALTRALLHPADRIAWLAVLRAPWCGIPLDDLVKLTSGAEAIAGSLSPDTRTIWQMINEESRVATLSADAGRRLIALREIIAPAIAVRRRRPLRDLVESVWLALRGPACLQDESALDDAVRLLDLLEVEAKAQSGGGDLTDLADFDAQVEKLFAGNRGDTIDGPPPVQIMTIHKAKGLEFDTVIIPALHRIPRQDERRLLAWSEQADPESGERELLLAPIRESGTDDETDAIYQFVRQHDREKQQQEDVRLLYVAATRAKRNLHLLASVSVKTDGDQTNIVPPRSMSLLASLWRAVEPVFVEALAAEPAPDSPRPAQRSDRVSRIGPVRLRTGYHPPSLPPALRPTASTNAAAPSSNIDFDWAGESARHVGTVVHMFLQQMAEQGIALWDEARIAGSASLAEYELTRLGVADAELAGASQRVMDALRRVIADERGHWMLSNHRGAKSEWRVTGLIDAVVVNVAIDRTFVDEAGDRWIIDYKTGAHEGGDIDAFLDNERARYRQQLETYARLLHAMHDGGRVGSTIRLGLYFPMLGGWREWTWSPPLM
ncbi:MAG: UvrD-helicase domain-containing protein [Betaproteobacteria bacterium]|nr:UvrD-helicase domain-containing protein [Betaproteobacteria bacterium]